MNNKAKLIQIVEQWDGKSTQPLLACYLTCSSQSDFIEWLVTMLHISKQQNGASWLLKHHLEQFGAIPSHHQNTILENLVNLQHWSAKLHILQCFPFLKISESYKNNVEYFLRLNLSHDNKFVRAWCYNGFYFLAQQYPEYTTEVKSFFKLALQDEAPSVKARLRNIIKSGFKL